MWFLKWFTPSFFFMQKCCNAYECDYSVTIYVQVQLFCSHGYYRMKLLSDKFFLNTDETWSQCQLCRNTTIIRINYN